MEHAWALLRRYVWSEAEVALVPRSCGPWATPEWGSCVVFGPRYGDPAGQTSESLPP